MQKKDTARQLVEKARKREPEAFTELMQLYMKDMYRVALAILMNDDDSADAIQDTILTCWEKIDTLKHSVYFKTWMTRILINKCYDIKKKTENVINLEEYEELATMDDYNLEFKEALSSLDEKYRTIMVLFYSEGYHIEEIAKIMKIPKSTVQTRLQRGREKLLTYYQKDERKEKKSYVK